MRKVSERKYYGLHNSSIEIPNNFSEFFVTISLFGSKCNFIEKKKTFSLFPKIFKTTKAFDENNMFSFLENSLTIL